MSLQSEFELQAHRHHDHRHQGSGDNTEHGGHRLGPGHRPQDNRRDQRDEGGKTKHPFDDFARGRPGAAAIDGQDHGAIGSQSQKRAQLVVKHGIGDSLGAEKRIDHGNAEKRGVAQRHHQEQGPEYLLPEVEQTPQRQDKHRTHRQHQPSHQERDEQIGRRRQLRHFQEHQGGQRDIDNEQVQGLGGIVRHQPKSSEPHAEQEQKQSRQEVFHFTPD